MNPFISSLAYERDFDAADAKHCWLEKASPALAEHWKCELDQTGIILDLGLERGDLRMIASETGRTVDGCLDEMAYEYLRNAA